MTTEQEKVIDRCKAMIKRAFPSMNGKFIFKLDSAKLGSKGIAVDMFLPDLKFHEEQSVQTVDIGM
jgi:hypothetical protein